MDHADVLEQLEVAAAEPRGLDRLLGGSSADGGAVAEHLAGCDSCRAELEDLRHLTSVAADVVQTTPRPELREQTLSFVASVGRQRAAEGVGASYGASAVPIAALGPAATAPVTRRRWSLRWPTFAWGAAFGTGVAAAALVTAIVLGQAYDRGLQNANAAIADQQRAIAGLASVTDWSMRLAADPDAETVRLASPSGSGVNVATVAYSAKGHEMVLVARSLPAAASNQEYRCWVESGGQRTLVGKMHFAGDLAYWAGYATTLPASDGHLIFGVSLFPTATPGVGGGTVVLTGSS